MTAQPSFTYSFPFLSSGFSFVTAEDSVQINIWRHVEHEECCCLDSWGHTRIMPVTGNIWTVNSCGDSINARVRGGLGAGWDKRGGGVLFWWSYGGKWLVTGHTRWPSRHTTWPYSPCFPFHSWGCSYRMTHDTKWLDMLEYLLPRPPSTREPPAYRPTHRLLSLGACFWFEVTWTEFTCEQLRPYMYLHMITTPPPSTRYT